MNLSLFPVTQQHDADLRQELAPEEVFALLRRIAQGDQDAMRTLHMRYNRRVYAFVLRRLGNAAEAEEVAVDTMFEVWRHPERFRGEARFSTWLLSIARHKLLNVIRSREPEHIDVDDELTHLPSAALDGFAALELKEKRDMLLHCIQRLPQEQRECMHLVAFEQLPLAEVARVQDCPESTVKTRMFHARQKLRLCLRRLSGEKGDQ